MNPKEFIALSTQVARDLKSWLDAARSEHGLSAEQLAILQAAADVIDQTAMRIAGPDAAGEPG
jgi:hypothetical protein